MTNSSGKIFVKDIIRTTQQENSSSTTVANGFPGTHKSMAKLLHQTFTIYTYSSTKSIISHSHLLKDSLIHFTPNFHFPENTRKQHPNIAHCHYYFYRLCSLFIWNLKVAISDSVHKKVHFFNMGSFFIRVFGRGLGVHPFILIDDRPCFVLIYIFQLSYAFN